MQAESIEAMSKSAFPHEHSETASDRKDEGKAYEKPVVEILPLDEVVRGGGSIGIDFAGERD